MRGPRWSPTGGGGSSVWEFQLNDNNNTRAPGRGLHSLTSELNLRTFANASLTLELNLSTFRTHPRVYLGYMRDKVSLR
jgi:hypothetical protein